MKLKALVLGLVLFLQLSFVAFLDAAPRNSNWCVQALRAVAVTAACGLSAISSGCTATSPSPEIVRQTPFLTVEDQTQLTTLTEEARASASDLDDVDTEVHFNSGLRSAQEDLDEAVSDELAVSQFFIDRLHLDPRAARTLALESLVRAETQAARTFQIKVYDVLPSNSVDALKWAWNYDEKEKKVPIFAIRPLARTKEFFYQEESYGQSRNFLKIVIPVLWPYPIFMTTTSAIVDGVTGWSYEIQNPTPQTISVSPHLREEINAKRLFLNARVRRDGRNAARTSAGVAPVLRAQDVDANLSIQMIYIYQPADPEEAGEIENLVGLGEFFVPGPPEFTQRWEALATAVRAAGQFHEPTVSVVVIPKSDDEPNLPFGQVRVTILGTASVPVAQLLELRRAHRIYNDGPSKLTIRLQPLSPPSEGEDRTAEQKIVESLESEEGN